MVKGPERGMPKHRLGPGTGIIGHGPGEEGRPAAVALQRDGGAAREIVGGRAAGARRGAAQARVDQPGADAARVSHAPLHYVSEHCEPLDPLQVFAAAGTAPRFYWEQPAARRFRVGIGCAARLTFDGPERFVQAEAGARELFARLAWEGDGPRIGHLVGGFAFMPGRGASGPWEGFADGELWLPELLYSRDGHRYTREAQRDGEWSELEPRTLAFGQPVRGAAEITNDQTERYLETVQQALHEIDAGLLQKLVVARAALVTARSPIDAVAWLVALRERFQGCTLFAIGHGDAVFLGATPERLVRVSGEAIETAAIAGTAPRGASQAADRALGEELRDCRKNGDEHAIVVRYLQSVLAECCDRVEVDAEPQLLKTRTVQHLCTQLRARQRAGSRVSVLELVGRLHPTPAIAGAPRAAALEWLLEHEHVARGWFSGPVGYVQSDGDGEFAVALRSAMVRGRGATAWAGAGIVAGSEPKAEFTETELKLRTVLGPLLWGSP
jgi:isochorismate synthase